MRILISLCLVWFCSCALSQEVANCAPSIQTPLLSQDLNLSCQAAIRAEHCSNVAEEDLINCSAENNSAPRDLWDFLKGCAQGALDSISELLNFMWEILKWSWSNTFSGETRSETSEEAQAYASSIKLYLHTEYEKAYSQASSPFRRTEAARAMGGAISQVVISQISEAVSRQYNEFTCMNQRARSEVICQLAGEIFIPPAAAIALIKRGSGALENFPSIGRAFERIGVARRIPLEHLRGPSGKAYSNTKKKNLIFDGEENGGRFGTNVRYLSEQERRTHEIFVDNRGRLRDHNGELLNTAVRNNTVNGNAIYVMDENGRIFLSTYQAPGLFHHSSLVAGGEVAAAGEMIIENGVVKMINRRSGHYRPSEVMMEQVVEELETRGVNLSRTIQEAYED